MKSQTSDIERNKPIEDGKKIGIDEIIRQNEKLKVSSIKQCYYIV